MALAEIAAAESGVLGPLAPQNGAVVDRSASDLRDGPASRDPVDLSPLGRRLAESGNSASDKETAVDLDVTSDLAGGGMIRNALNTMKGDLARVLSAFGLDGEAIDSFARAFVEPVLDALNANASFHAELSFSAFSEVTRMTNASFNQETSLSARSLEIDVNHATGEVAVTFANLTVEQEVFIVQGGNDAPILTIGPGFGAPPPIGGPEDDPDDPIVRLLHEAREQLATLTKAVNSSISLDGLEQYIDETGHTHSKFSLQASTPLGPASPQGAQEPLDILA